VAHALDASKGHGLAHPKKTIWAHLVFVREIVNNLTGPLKPDNS
jgi:hypothetical protein